MWYREGCLPRVCLPKGCLPRYPPSQVSRHLPTTGKQTPPSITGKQTPTITGKQTPPHVSRHPPPSQVSRHPPEMATAAVSTHSTGMHSCFTGFWCHSYTRMHNTPHLGARGGYPPPRVPCQGDTPWDTLLRYPLHQDTHVIPTGDM